MLTTLNCGYDTDCTVATLGSLLGILYGSDYLDPYRTEPLGENQIVSRPIAGFNAPKSILELTELTIAARKLLPAHYEQEKDKSMYQIPYQSYVETYSFPREHSKNTISSLKLGLNGCKQLSFETTLCLADAGGATLKLVCAIPLRAYPDGELLLDCPDRTIVIPAYHRADPRKCAVLPKGSGEYRLRVGSEDASSFAELYFMVVSPDFYWAYRIDSTFSIK